MPQDEKEDSPNEKALTAFTVRAFSFQSWGTGAKHMAAADLRTAGAPSLHPYRRVADADRRWPDGTDGVLL